ncbi:DNA primase catalytic subunit PriS, partial [Candidatus Marsarchaeota archaeon]|nr:DNA primase catalytic subunit PriS [Candidatus Marsarchaeota archaeon]
KSVESLAIGLFREFYSKNPIGISDIPKREFGFGNFETKIARRHMAFKNEEELRRYITANVPAYISTSSALYENPAGRPMENKGWQGSELVFDLDATDLHLACQKRHGNSWVCENCLHEVKMEVFKLVEQFLVPDFGFSLNDISVNFSGNRGYHVHVKSEAVMMLDGRARKEISDYITGSGMKLESFFPTIGKRGARLIGPKPNDPGWGGKIARNVINTLNAGPTSIMALGVPQPIAKRLYANKASVILGITTGNWDKVNIPKKEDFWKNVAGSISVRQSDSIDKNVTNDPQHLLRAAGTLHGGSGLVSKAVPSFKALSTFDPMKECIAFPKGEIFVVANTKEKLLMNGMEYGPYENKRVSLPSYAAIYLLLKRMALLP